MAISRNKHTYNRNVAIESRLNVNNIDDDCQRRW